MPPRKKPGKQAQQGKGGVPKMTEQLQKLLTCGKCGHMFDLTARRPKMLVCHHSFCMQCIQSCIKNKNNQIAPCPTCSKCTSIGRNGVAALPNNDYLWPQLKLLAKTESGSNKKPVDPDVFVSDDEEEEAQGKYAAVQEARRRDEACGGDSDDSDDSSTERKRRTEVHIFCETCLGIAQAECLKKHQICNYEAGIKSLQERLRQAVEEAGENLVAEVQLLEQGSNLMGRIQTCWSSLGHGLDQRLLSQTVDLSAAKALLEQLPSSRKGISEARFGDPSTLVHTVLDTEGINSNSGSRLTVNIASTNVWKIISNCNLKIQSFNSTTNEPEDFVFTLQLDDNSNDDAICVMYALNKILEAKQKKPNEKEKESADDGASCSYSRPSGRSKQFFSSADSEWVQMKKNRGGEGAIPKKFDALSKLKIPKNISAGCSYCFFDLVKGDNKLGRVILEISCKSAPKMSKNFLELCTGKFGITYQGCSMWRIPAADHIDGGDLCNSTASKEAGFVKKPFYGDASTMQDDVGMLRMRGMGTSEDGQPIVSSQFMVWVRARKFKSYARTLVFGRVVEGLDKLTEIPETRNRLIVIQKCGIMQ